MRWNEAFSRRAGAAARRGRCGGFTMIEMVMVISIMLFLLGVLAVVVGSVQATSQRQSTAQLIDAIESALVMYYDINGEYPDLSASNDDNTTFYANDIGFGRAQCLYWHLTSPEKGACMKSIPASAARTPPYKEGTSKSLPYLVDAWQNPIQVAVFEDDEKASLQNGGVPLVASWGPNGRGHPYDEFTGSTDLSSKLASKDDDVSDDLTNFRDLPEN